MTDYDDALDEFERRDSLRLEPEHRVRLVRALVESDTPAKGAPQDEIDAWVEATDAGPLSDDFVVTFASQRIAELNNLLRRVKDPLVRSIIAEHEARADLDARRNAPLKAIADKSAANIRRAVDLKAAGHPDYRIAQVMSDERGINTDASTVRRWLRAAESRTDHDSPDSS